MNKGIGEEHAIAQHNSRHVADPRGGHGEDAGGVTAYDLFTTPHSFVKVSKPMIGYGGRAAAPGKSSGYGQSSGYGAVKKR